MKTKEYKITFTSEHPWSWRSKEDTERQMALVQKYKGKAVKLHDLPAFITEVGVCVISNDEIEIYNDYRE